MYHNLRTFLKLSMLQKIAIALFLFIVWVLFHSALLTYGTGAIPLHKTHIGDEQSPINAGLHILKDRDILSIRNSGTYYGPIMGTLSIPAAVGDFGARYLNNEIETISDYQNLLVWDWGGVIVFARLISLLAGFLGLVALYLIVKELIPKKKYLYPTVFSVLLLATNLIYFEYSSFFRFWIFMEAILLWQLYLLILITKQKISPRFGFRASAVLGVLSFGLVYLSVIFQAFWLPYLYTWLKNMDRKMLIGFVQFSITYVVGAILIIVWYPDPFFRVFKMGLSPESVSGPTSIVDPLAYYGSLLLTGSAPLLLALLLLLAFYYKHTSQEIKRFIFAILMTIVAYSSLLLFVGWREGRYFLPLSVLLVVLVSVLLGSQRTADLIYVRQIFIKRVVLLLLALQVCFGAFIAFKTYQIYDSDPSEIAIIKSFDPSERIVVIRTRFYGMNELVGVAHNKKAYDLYFKLMNLDSLDYFGYLMTTEPPSTESTYDIYYTNFGTLKLQKEVLISADHYVSCYHPIWDGTSLGDPFNRNVFQLFYPKAMNEECFILK